jgi:hypothetical protein
MKDPICPFLKKACIQHDCMMFTHLTMIHPQTGAGVDEFGCAIAWMPILLIEGSNQSRKVAASVDSARNEITTRQDVFNQLVVEARKGPLKIE